MQIWAESGKSALPICNYSQILYQFLTFTQNLKRSQAFALYLIVDTILVMLYCAIWIICFKKNSVFRALALSIIHSMLFLFSGIMSRSVLLIIASVLFAPSHIVISYKNVK